MRLVGTMEVIENELCIGGMSVTRLREEYGTPLYVGDETYFKDRIKTFINGFKSTVFDTSISFASKSFSNIYIIEIVSDMGLNLDVVSGGEIHTALEAGFNPSKIRFHGNNKLEYEIEYALANGISYFIIDSFADYDLLNEVNFKFNKEIEILLRVNMDVNSLTKFGVNISNPETIEFIKKIAEDKNITLKGIHCHIGGDFTNELIFFDNARRMLSLASYIENKTGINIDTINLGGGYGTHYTDSDKIVDYSIFLPKLIKIIENEIDTNNLNIKHVAIEPGRSLINSCVTTIYSIGNIKEMDYDLPFVFIDGGMTDNPRPGLYNSEYEAVLANKINDSKTGYYRVAGKSCESEADTLVKKSPLPNPQRGDIIAIPCSGAYTYSMSSNYNRNVKPAIVFVNDGTGRVAVKREDYNDLVRNDLHYKKE